MFKSTEKIIVFIVALLPLVKLNCTTIAVQTSNNSTKSDGLALVQENLNTEETLNKCIKSRVEYVPVTLEHPLFKVFGINPRDYVVYYRYKIDVNGDNTDTLPVHKLDKIITKAKHSTIKKARLHEVSPNNVNFPLRKLKQEHEIRTRRKVEKFSNDDINAEGSVQFSPIDLTVKYFF